MIRQLPSVAIPLALAISLSACSVVGGSSSVESGAPSVEDGPSGPNVLADEELTAEYVLAITEFPYNLPDQYEYPADLGLEYRPIGGAFEGGAGEVIVAYTWLCSWESEYLDAFDEMDQQRIDAALDMLGKWKFLPNASLYMEDPEDDWTRVVLDPAREGDPSGVQGDQGSTCAGVQID